MSVLPPFWKLNSVDYYPTIKQKKINKIQYKTPNNKKRIQDNNVKKLKCTYWQLSCQNNFFA